MLSSTPQVDDAILGGDRPAPISSMVLGGLSGLQQRFQASDTDVQIDALQSAADFGDEAIPLLQQGLASDELQVRAVAYEVLQHMGSEEAIAAAGPGIPLRVGDRVYGTYRSSVSYGDDWYYIEDAIDEEWFYEDSDFAFHHTATNASGEEFVYITDNPEENKRDIYDEVYYPKLLRLHWIQSEAKQQAETEHRQRLLKLEVDYSEILPERPDSVDVSALAKSQGIACPQEIEEDDWNYQVRLLKMLQREQKLDELMTLWTQLGYEALAFVHEHVIDRPCYLRQTSA